MSKKGNKNCTCASKSILDIQNNCTGTNTLLAQVPADGELFKQRFHILSKGVKQKFFLSADIINYFCLTCTPTKRFQKAAPAPNNENVSGNYLC